MRKKKSSTYDHTCVGEQLKKARIYRGCDTQGDVCEIVDVSRQVWSLWEKGDRIPSIEKLLSVAEALELDFAFFCTRDADPADHDLNPQKKFTKKAAIKKVAVKKAAVKKAAKKKVAAKKTTKKAAKKTASKKSTAKKATTKKTTSKKTASKKSTSKKSTGKKAAPKKTAGKKASPKKSSRKK